MRDSSAQAVQVHAGSRRTLALHDPAPGLFRGLVADLWESGARVARGIRLPRPAGIVGFFGNQLLVNAVAWTAGMVAVHLVQRFFEVRGFRNLWGLFASGDRSVVSGDEYRLITIVTSYTAGLLILIGIRHLALRMMAEFHDLRRVRAGRSPRAGSRSAGAIELVLEDPMDG